MKRWISILLILVISLSLCGCGRSDSSEVSAPPEESISVLEHDLESEAVEEEASDVDTYTAFREAISLEQADVDIDSLPSQTSYHGLRLSATDCALIGDQYVISQSALYNGVAQTLERICANEGFLYDSADEEFFEILLGTSKPLTFDSFRNSAEKLSSFIVFDATEREIFKALEPLKSVTGNFDFEKRVYSFEIKDLKDAAEELGITEVMLGYMLAYTTIYSVNNDQDYQWSKNAVKINVVLNVEKSEPLKSFDVNQPSYVIGDVFNRVCRDYICDLNDILAELSFSVKAMDSSNSYSGWIYDQNDTSDAIATIVFSGPDGDVTIDSDMDKISAYAASFKTEKDNLAAAVVGFLMCSDPVITVDRAKEIGSELVEGLKTDSVSSIKTDGIIFMSCRTC